MLFGNSSRATRLTFCTIAYHRFFPKDVGVEAAGDCPEWDQDKGSCSPGKRLSTSFEPSPAGASQHSPGRKPWAVLLDPFGVRWL